MGKRLKLFGQAFGGFGFLVFLVAGLSGLSDQGAIMVGVSAGLIAFGLAYDAETEN